MGTRGLIGCRWDGELHGSYNHFDSYPSGLGEDVVTFCRQLAADDHMFETFARNYKAVEWIEDDQDLPTVEQREKAMRAGFKIETAYLDELQAMGANRDTPPNWYWVTRDMQGVGNFVQVLNGWPFLIDYSSFINDSLFCEYAYVLDLDRKVLEFWRGFQKVFKGDPGYAEIEDDEHKDRDSMGTYKYGPCKKVGERAITDLDGWKDFYGPEDDE